MKACVFEAFCNVAHKYNEPIENRAYQRSQDSSCRTVRHHPECKTAFLVSITRACMRTLGWLCAVLLNAALACGAILFAVEPEQAVTARAFASAAVIAFLAVVVFLLLARLRHLPHWAPNAMRLICASVPVVFFLGSLDLGIVSGLEIYSILLASLFAWGNLACVYAQFNNGLTCRSRSRPSVAGRRKSDTPFSSLADNAIEP